jgi:hypothetical protein
MPPLRAEAAEARMANSAASRFEPLYETHPLTGAAIEVFYAHFGDGERGFHSMVSARFV